MASVWRIQGWLSALVFCPLLGSFLSGCEAVQCLAQLFVGRMRLDLEAGKRKTKQARLLGSVVLEKRCPVWFHLDT